ncbi:DUF4262 domain-containing protein [Sphingobium xenophagum]|uniref:DUF4262 domain-containing protein n=1 Tax=Sphingobium xenophagum TaxID=121428 RepID=UPI0020CEAB10|nr:DUF4262 domain-containing protein [Sphingobium xenophagum]
MGNTAGGVGEVSDRSLTDYEMRIIANVRDEGCQVVSVFDPEDDAKSFAYSVGFWESVHQPEVIILGLPSQMGVFAVNETHRQCEAGLTLFDGQSVEGLFEDYDVTCIARSVDKQHLTPEYLNSALWYHNLRTGKPLDAAYQLVWAYEGLWPWDAGAPAELLEDQPQLYSGILH